jgi:hypothetical protein
MFTVRRSIEGKAGSVLSVAFGDDAALGWAVDRTRGTAGSLVLLLAFTETE